MYPEMGMLDCNSYVIKGQTNIVIDPGSPDMVNELVRKMERDGIDAKKTTVICNTHMHIDHTLANEGFRKATGASIIIHPLQKEFFNISFYETANLFAMHPEAFEENGYFKTNDLKEFGFDWELIPSPGHSRDSICFYSAHEKCLISGDVVFAGNTGRYDLPGGNPVQLGDSIRNLANYDIEILLPGHMGVVKGAEKVKSNFNFVKEFFAE